MRSRNATNSAVKRRNRIYVQGPGGPGCRESHQRNHKIGRILDTGLETWPGSVHWLLCTTITRLHATARFWGQKLTRDVDLEALRQTGINLLSPPIGPKRQEPWRPPKLQMAIFAHASRSYQRGSWIQLTLASKEYMSPQAGEDRNKGIGGARKYNRGDCPSNIANGTWVFYSTQMVGDHEPGETLTRPMITMCSNFIFPCPRHHCSSTRVSNGNSCRG